ncbi:MAG TPA: hypothetical protein G4N93_02075 [Dehalococcoidia bacterium]|nr:hypothetical protein [Dehalococcoidia bacterium]
MDATIGGIIGAGIIAFGSIIANIILARSRALEKDKTKSVLEGITTALETVGKEAEKRHGYGYGARYVKSKAIIEDLEGKTRITREYHGVAVIADEMRLLSFPEEVWVGAPGKIVIEPHPLPQVERPNFRKHIGLVPEQFGEQLCKFRIEVEGGLTKADGEIAYGIEWTCSRAACMTKEQAVETYAGDVFKKEYFCFDVRFPIDEAEIEIEFPDGYNVKAFPGVFLAGSETWHDLELQRIKEGIEPTSRGARLKINNPELGYRYLIFWVPLSRREVEQLRSK